MGPAVLFFAVDIARVVGFFGDVEVLERLDWATVDPFVAGFLPGVFALFATLVAG